MNKNIKNISLYTFVSFFTKSFSLLIVPIIAHNLSVEDFGKYTIIISIVALFQSIYLFGFEHSLNYYFNKFKSTTNKNILVSTQFFFITIVSLITLIIISLIFNSKVDFLNLILFLCFLSIILSYFSSLLKVNMQAIFFTKSQVLKSTVLLITIYLFVNIFNLNIEGILLANIIAILISIIYMFISIKNYFTMNISFNLLKKVLSYGLPLMPAGTILWASTQLDRYYILYFINEYVLGIYGFALSIGLIPVFLKMAFKSALDPFVMKTFHNEPFKTKQYISGFFTLNIYVFSFIFLLISIFAKDAVLIIGGEKYLESILYIPFILFTVSITTLNQYFIYGINFNKENKLVLKGLLYMLVINIILAYSLIHDLHVYGILFSNIVANIFYTYYLYKSSNKIYTLNYNFRMNVQIFLSSFTLFSINASLSNDSYILKLALIIIFLLVNIKI